MPASHSLVFAIFILTMFAVLIPFSLRFYQGSSRRAYVLALMACLASSLLVFLFCGHLVPLLLTWTLSNVLLVLLMFMGSPTANAVLSARMAAKTLGFGTVCLAVSLVQIAWKVQSFDLLDIANAKDADPVVLIALLLAILCQTALWPFNSWLLNSLDAPTPISALMHAGVINAGGILLLRLHPLLLDNPLFLTVLFSFGFASASLGSLWKFIQADYKRMLVASTVAQMGFMVMQIGLGLFSFAAAHIVWHGLFKAYLFLSSPSVLKEKPKTARTHSFGIQAVLGGFVAMGIFTVLSPGGVQWDASILVKILVVLSGVHLAASLESRAHLALNLATVCIFTGLYCLNVGFFEHFLDLKSFPVPLNFIHIISWLLILLPMIWVWIRKTPTLPERIYAWLLSGSVASSSEISCRVGSDSFPKRSGGERRW